MADRAPTLSKRQVSKAGSTLRKYKRGECSQEEVKNALEVIYAYRASFTTPLNKVLAKLNELGDSVEGLDITKRTKRFVTIIDKLTERETGIDLARMQDIGGCRVVVPARVLLQQVVDEILNFWPGAKVTDYYQNPRTSGYRSVHIIVTQDGLLIEIQVRAPAAHQVAQFVETVSRVTGENFKTDGSHIVQTFAREYACFLELEENGEIPPRGLLSRLQELRSQVTDFLRNLKEDGDLSQ